VEKTILFEGEEIFRSAETKPWMHHAVIVFQPKAGLVEGVQA
jgi:hypothetical protein